MKRFSITALITASLLFADCWTLAGHAQTAGGDEIAALQHRLKDAGCLTGAEDGKPGAALDIAVRACPSQDPMLRIETGMHVAAINQIDADASCRLFVTGSDDKTARLWSAADAHLLRTFRPPIGPGAEGKIRGAALSPDGRFAAVGGWDPLASRAQKDFIYVFDTANGTIVARLGGFGDVILRLAFSPDGRWLAASGAVRQGVRMYETATWTLVASDTNYGADTYGLAFGPDGRLYTAAFDGFLRGYRAGPSFAKTQQAAIKGGRLPQSLAVDPQGALIAVGFIDAGRVSLFDTERLRFRYATAQVENGALWALAWNADGSRLSAGGSYQYPAVPERPMAVVTFDRAGHRLQTLNVADNSITSLRTCGTGTLVAAEERGLGFIDGSGAMGWRPSTMADLRNKIGEALTISPDATQVRFGLAYGAGRPVLFDLGAGTVLDSPSPAASFAAPIVNGPVTGWFNGWQPAYAGRPLPLNHLEVGRSLALFPNRQGFVLGSNFRLRAYDSGGNPLWDLSGPGDAWGVDVTPDSRVIVAAYGDGTIRWHRAADGKELLALFVEVPGKRWIAWTPAGYFMASPGGEDLIGWHVNRGWDQAADFFPVARFRDRFNRPDIVRLVLATLDEEAAVKQANETARRRDRPVPLISALPPILRILAPAAGVHSAESAVTINYAWRVPSGQAVDRIAISIDGRPVKEVGLALRPDTQSEITGSVKVDLRNRNNEVGLIAWSGERSSAVASVNLVWDNAPSAASETRKLYALIVGVSAYADKDMALAFAAKDAHDFGATLEQQKGAYYQDVETRVLTDGAVTRSSMISGLEWLEKAVATPGDVGVLFLAGHGMTDDRQMYWFLPSDAGIDDVRAKGVSQDEMRRSLQTLPGKVLWFLDTCHAGNAASRPADINVLVNTVTAPENGGIVTFASSTGKELSEERTSWNNGAFTKAIREGIDQGQADLFHEGKITTSQLDAFLEKRVQELTDGKQHPVMARPPQEPDFTIAQTKSH
ncbi:MAG: caspase family protein [Beijerinckiaceae bacterium]|nr:caspase family protein [Beijerinckiaceae bacterium]